MRKLLICFDSTGSSAESHFGLTNVLKIAIRAGWNGSNKKDSFFANQKVLYYSGPGTRGWHLARIFNQIFSPELTIRNIILSAKKDLIKQNLSAEDKIFVIGFSRGAGIARRFSVLLSNGAIVKKIKNIEFLGCFDTVAQIGFPSFNKFPDDKVCLEDNKIADGVKRALHCVALDETRSLFPVVLMDCDDRVEEIWFRGDHSDVGGGHRAQGLSDISLEKMLKELMKSQIILENAKEICSHFRPNIDFNELLLNPDYMTKVHTHTDIFSPRIPVVIDCGKVSFTKKPYVHMSVKKYMEEKWIFKV